MPYLILLLILAFLTGCGSSSIQEISGQQGFQQDFAPDTLIINADRTQLTVGEKATLTARLHPPEGEGRDVTDLVSWSSSAATVAAAPGADGLLTALTPGKTEIQATLGDLSSDSLSLTVNAPSGPAVTGLRIEDGGVTLQGRGGTVGYRAMATFTDNSELDVTDQTTWASR